MRHPETAIGASRHAAVGYIILVLLIAGMTSCGGAGAAPETALLEPSVGELEPGAIEAEATNGGEAAPDATDAALIVPESGDYRLVEAIVVRSDCGATRFLSEAGSASASYDVGVNEIDGLHSLSLIGPGAIGTIGAMIEPREGHQPAARYEMNSEDWLANGQRMCLLNTLGTMTVTPTGETEVTVEAVLRFAEPDPARPAELDATYDATLCREGLAQDRGVPEWDLSTCETMYRLRLERVED